MADMYEQAKGMDLNEPYNVAKQLRVGDQEFLKGQRGDTGEFLGRFTNFMNSQPTARALSERIGSQMGLPQMQQNANTLQNQMYELPATYSAATTGHDVNANQLSRIVGAKTAQLAPIAQRATDQAQFATGQANQMLGNELQDRDRALIPYQQERDFLNDRIAREASFFSQANERELDSIIQKMNAGITLNEGERTRANELAVAETNYRAQIESAKIANQRPMALSPGQGIYNPSDGKYKQFGWG